jgi:pectate lyase
MKKASFFLFAIFIFALDNPVSAALPSNELWREALTNNVIGFGKNTTGGKGGTLCQVTNLNDSGAGSLRACAEAVGPMWITFTVSGTISLQSVIHIKSNKTIDGRGQNIVISNNGLVIGTWTYQITGPVTNIIIHNISMKNNYSNGMIIIAENASNVWIDHNTFQNAADEIMYVGSGSPLMSNHIAPYGVTISWNYCPAATAGQVWGDKCILVSDGSDTVDVATTITIHHNHYQTYGRHPLARWAMMHAFNNYYHKDEIGAQIRSNGRFYSENEIFEAPYANAYPMVKVDGYPPEGEGSAANVKVVNPWLINGATVEQINPSTIFVPSSYYSYTPDTANAALQTAIINTAGRQDVAPPTTLQAPTNLLVLQ